MKGDLKLPNPRTIEKYYSDPIEMIWEHCIHHLGWQLSRSNEVFASWDGKSTLTIAKVSDLDPDDSLAQLILHELCHACIEGKAAWSKTDWGLDNTNEQHLVNELACHRLQAALADQVDLRTFFAVTTDWRPYYDQIPEHWDQAQNDEQIMRWSEAFNQDINDARYLDLHAIKLAQRGFSLLKSEEQFWGALSTALEQSKSIAQVLKPIVTGDSLWF